MEPATQRAAWTDVELNKCINSMASRRQTMSRSHVMLAASAWQRLAALCRSAPTLRSAEQEQIAHGCMTVATSQPSIARRKSSSDDAAEISSSGSGGAAATAPLRTPFVTPPPLPPPTIFRSEGASAARTLGPIVAAWFCCRWLAVRRMAAASRRSPTGRGMVGCATGGERGRAAGARGLPVGNRYR